MAHCHHLSRGWLLTDARIDRHGVAAARRLPPNSVILVRSDALSRPQRQRLIRQLRRIAGVRHLTLIVAGVSPGHARRVGADGVHLRDRSAQRAAQARRLGLTTSAPVHDAREAQAAARAKIDQVLISPLFATRSHPGAPTLSIRQFANLARLSRASVVVALGGMTRARHRQLIRRRAAGTSGSEWAAIDAWDVRTAGPQRQKRNCVPT